VPSLASQMVTFAELKPILPTPGEDKRVTIMLVMMVMTMRRRRRMRMVVMRR
jgi:hypothetical protein